MSDYFFDGQVPNYRSADSTKSIKIDPVNNQIVINDSTIPKTLTINSQQFSNGTNNLLFSLSVDKRCLLGIQWFYH